MLNARTLADASGLKSIRKLVEKLRLNCFTCNLNLLTLGLCRNQQAYALAFMDALLPQLGSSVPAPAVLSAVNCSYEIFVENSENVKESARSTPEQMKSLSKLESLPAVVLSAPIAGNSNPLFSREKDKEKMHFETTIMSICDDGRLLHWSVTSGDSSEMKSGNANEDSNFGNKIDETISNGELGRQELLPGKVESSTSYPTFKVGDECTDSVSFLFSHMWQQWTEVLHVQHLRNYFCFSLC